MTRTIPEIERLLAEWDAKDAKWSARVGVLKVSIKALEMQVATANARIAGLKGALQPFADAADEADELSMEDYHQASVDCGDCRTARATLKEQPE